MIQIKVTKGSSLLGIVCGSCSEYVAGQELIHPEIDGLLFFPLHEEIGSSFGEIKEQISETRHR